MFFLMGINEKRTYLEFHQTVICSRCGAYGRYMVFMTCTVLSLFFIPCFKWNRKYYVRMSCCNSLYQLNQDVGRRIERGEEIQIKPEDLQQLQDGEYAVKTCENCGFTTTQDYSFCPKCGSKF